MRTVRIAAPYDEALDPTTWRGFNLVAAVNNARKCRPEWKNELTHYKQGKAARNSARAEAARSNCDQRLAAEQNMANTVRAAVQALEFAMNELKQAPLSSKAGTIVNQLQIFNAVVHLRTKCKVRFEDNDGIRKVDLDRTGP